MISTELDFKLNNNEFIKLTLNFSLLLKIKAKYPEEYESFSKVVLYGDKKEMDFFELLTVIYVAYLCANLDNKEKYTKEEFISLVPFDVPLITLTQNKLLGYRKN